jgi:hypothetical protein
MIKRIGWIAVLVVAGACAKDKEKKPEGGAKPADKAIDAGLRSPAELFTGTKVTMPEHVAKIRFGMSEADAKAAHPDVFAAKYGYKVPGFAGVETTVQINDGRVYQTYMKIDTPQDELKKMIAAKWGPPTWEMTNSIGAPEIYWDNPDDGLRLHLERYAKTNSMVRFDPVVSADAVLGSDPKTFGFEKLPLIGATQDDMMKTYDIYRPTPRKDDPGSITFATHDIAGTDAPVHLDVRVKDGKVTGYYVTFPPQLHDKLMPRLEQMFGPGKLDANKLYTDFKGPPPVKAEIRNGDGYGTSLWVGNTKK